MTLLESRYIPAFQQSLNFLGLGTIELGRDWGIGKQERLPLSELEAIHLLNKVLDIGINVIDTASAYQQSEARIGKAISHRRNEYFLITKCGEHSHANGTYYDFSYRAILNSIDKSLTLLHTDRIDLLFIHFGPHPEEVIRSGETLAAMQAARQAGKIRFLGASIDGKLAESCINSGSFDAMELEYNLLNKTNKTNIELCQYKGMGVFIRGGLGTGLLTSRIRPYLNNSLSFYSALKTLLELVNGDYDLLRALALHFLKAHAGISSVVVGSKNIEHIQDNLCWLNQDLNNELLEKAQALSFQLDYSFTIDAYFKNM